MPVRSYRRSGKRLRTAASRRGYKFPHKGVYHHFSVKHLQRYVDEFAGRHGVRELNTLEQMGSVVAGMVGKRLSHSELVAD